MKPAIEAARSGHDAVLTPTSHTYFDYYQSRDQTREPLAIGGFLPLDRVYGWEPMPPGLDPQFQPHILGVQGQLWTEYMPGPESGRVHGIPPSHGARRGRLDTVDTRNLDDFRARLVTHLERLRMLDVNFRPLDP